MKINGAELTIYTDEGDSVEIDLSPMQLKAVISILGIKPNGQNEITCFSDKSLKEFCEKTIGKWIPLE